MAPHARLPSGNNTNPGQKKMLKKDIDIFRKRGAPLLPFQMAAYEPPAKHTKQASPEKPTGGHVPDHSTSESDSDDEDPLLEGMRPSKKMKLLEKSHQPKSSINDMLLIEDDSQENAPEPEPARQRLSCREQQVNVNQVDVEKEMLSLVGNRQSQALSVDVGIDKEVSDTVTIVLLDQTTNKRKSYKLKRFDTFNKIYGFHAQKHPEWADMLLMFKHNLVQPFHTPVSLGGADVEELILELAHEPKEPEPEEEDDVILVEQPASCESDDESKMEMFLKLRFSDKDAIQVKVRKDKALRYMAKTVCKERGLSMGQVRLYFDSAELDLQQTPTDLDMENDDLVEVHVS